MVIFLRPEGRRAAKGKKCQSGKVGFLLFHFPLSFFLPLPQTQVCPTSISKAISSRPPKLMSQRERMSFLRIALFLFQRLFRQKEREKKGGGREGSFCLEIKGGDTSARESAKKWQKIFPSLPYARFRRRKDKLPPILKQRGPNSVSVLAFAQKMGLSLLLSPQSSSPSSSFAQQHTNSVRCYSSQEEEEEAGAGKERRQQLFQAALLFLSSFPSSHNDDDDDRQGQGEKQ